MVCNSYTLSEAEAAEKLEEAADLVEKAKLEAQGGRPSPTTAYQTYFGYKLPPGEKANALLKRKAQNKKLNSCIRP